MNRNRSQRLERDIDANPYSPDEVRVAKYIVDLTGIGAGDDPIGFLIASHRSLADERKKLLALCQELTPGQSE